VVVIVQRGLRRQNDAYRHPILYLPISGIPCPNDDTTLAYQKKTLSSEPERRFRTNQTRTKSPRAQISPSEHTHLPRSVRILHGCVHLLNSLKMACAPLSDIRIFYSCLRYIYLRQIPKITQFPYQS
jgi:hypothetical protein